MLYVLLLALVAVGVEGALARRRLAPALAAARQRPPIDAATGLLSHRAFAQRVAGEMNRARRARGRVWLCVWTIVEGDTELFGRVTAMDLHFPEVGFRLADRVYCVVRTNATDDTRSALIARLRKNAAPGTTAAVAEAVFDGAAPAEGPVDERAALRLLYQAIDRLS